VLASATAIVEEAPVEAAPAADAKDAKGGKPAAKAPAKK
jgi:hypothetical protein